MTSAPPTLRRAAALALALAAFAARGANAQTPIDPALAAATFDTAWATIHRSHFDSTFGGLSWTGVRDELRPRAAAAKTNEALREVLGEMVGRLGLSHFGVIPGDAQAALDAEGEEDDGPADAPPGETGMEVRLVGERFLVTRVLPGSAADAAGIRPGWAIEAVGDRESAALLKVVGTLPGAEEPRKRQLYGWTAIRARLDGRAGAVRRIRFEDGAGARRTVALTLGPASGTVTKYGNLPAIVVRAERERRPLPGGGTAGVIRFNYWMPTVIREMDAAVDELRDTDGIVVDLRGNVGGVGFMAAGYAGHFIDRPDTLATLVTRENRLYYIVNPRRVNARAEAVRPFAGPVAVLVDPVSVSTSEFFAGGLQKLGRARVFGETSAGQALPAFAKRLPNGDVLMHAVADFTGPGGERFEGAGVVPDEPAPPTREALLAGGDPALDAALRWIASQKKDRAPAR
ncbi:MAG TPA: S41 family peptidase [Longimicrobium sp.]|nr:S41 family peptidase [Longimicrobium sp.]